MKNMLALLFAVSCASALHANNYMMHGDDMNGGENATQMHRRHQREKQNLDQKHKDEKAKLAKKHAREMQKRNVE